MPKPYLEALSELQDRLPSFPSSIAFQLIQEELGRPIEEVRHAAVAAGRLCLSSRCRLSL